MTICISAICENYNMIVTASDRMITTGDVQFEPDSRKVIPLTRSIFLLIAGDTPLQYEIIRQLKIDVDDRIEKDPTDWLNVSDVADLYAKYYFQVKRQKAENEILRPLGLDSDSFISRQKNMDQDFISKISNAIVYFKMDIIETIITGIDNRGAHIFKFENEKNQDFDGVGFASIGYGMRHSESEFMFAGHSGFRKLPETLLLAYSAKKRAEVAPGVGEATDMHLIGPYLGYNYQFTEDDPIFPKIEEIYKKTKSSIADLNVLANIEIKSYLEELLKQASKQAQEMKKPNEVIEEKKPEIPKT